jgi:hypothetical protein
LVIEPEGDGGSFDEAREIDNQFVVSRHDAAKASEIN